MRRSTVVSLIVGVSFVALIVWVASNTYWVDTKVPMPPKGEAVTNPFYAAQRFVEALGSRSAWDRVLTLPPTSSVIVLSGWHWNLSTGRREALEGWVESGGRLVVDRMLLGGDSDFERWSGIVREYLEWDDAEDEDSVEPKKHALCRKFGEEQNGVSSSSASDAPRYWLCDLDDWSFLTTKGNALWALRDETGIHAMRTRVGRGSVTVINATPFRDRKLFDGDHGWLFVATTQMRPGDDVHFLSEDDHPSLHALLWQRGAPAVVLALTLLAVVLWRGGVRFGPLESPPGAARRSLAEQIRGTGQFALRHGSGDPLHTASARALEEAAQRRVPGYAGLSASERTAALVRLTGVDPDSLAAALYHPGLRRSHELRSTIALLEAARRTLIEHTRFSHGTH